jgi:hypothetical protein
VSVLVWYSGACDMYQFKAGYLGIFRRPADGGMQFYTWDNQSVNVEHPAAGLVGRSWEPK